MNFNTIFFAIIPFSLMIIISLGMPFYRVAVMKKAGEKLLPLTKRSNSLSLITSAIAFLLMLFSVRIDFGKLNFVIPYCGVLGIFIATRESTFLPVNGVYENLIVVGSDLIWYKDIDSFPMESYSEEERSRVPDYVLIVLTKKRSKRTLTFNNANEMNEAYNVIKQQMGQKV